MNTNASPIRLAGVLIRTQPAEEPSAYLTFLIPVIGGIGVVGQIVVALTGPAVSCFAVCDGYEHISFCLAGAFEPELNRLFQTEG